MTQTEFIDWLRGFTEGVHHYNITPKQWDYLKSKLAKVKEKSKVSYTVNSNIWTTTSTN